MSCSPRYPCVASMPRVHCTQCAPRIPSTHYMQRTACFARTARGAPSARTRCCACCPHNARPARTARTARYATYARRASQTRLACIARLHFCMQCTHRVNTQNSRSTHSLASNESKHHPHVTHCCESSADREQLGCHDYQIARRSRHRIETCDSPSPSDFRGSRRTLLGSQLTKGGYIGIGNLRCARRTIRCARRTNCSTIASGSCPAIRQCIALARMEGTGQPREAGKTACHFRNFLISAPGHVNGSLYPLKARTYFIPSGSEHRGQKDSHEPHGS